MGFQSLILSAVLFVALFQSIESESFFDIGCKGQYDTVGWAKVDRIIEDCFSLMRSWELYKLTK